MPGCGSHGSLGRPGVGVCGPSAAGRPSGDLVRSDTSAGVATASLRPASPSSRSRCSGLSPSRRTRRVVRRRPSTAGRAFFDPRPDASGPGASSRPRSCHCSSGGLPSSRFRVSGLKLLAEPRKVFFGHHRRQLAGLGAMPLPPYDARPTSVAALPCSDSANCISLRLGQRRQESRFVLASHSRPSTSTTASMSLRPGRLPPSRRCSSCSRFFTEAMRSSGFPSANSAHSEAATAASAIRSSRA